MRKKISMRSQITILFFCLVLFPIFIVFTVAGNMFTESSENDLKTICTTNIREIGSGLDIIFNNALDLTLYPLMEDSLRNYLTADQTETNFKFIKQNAANMLNSIPYGYRTAIHDIGLYTETGDFIISNANVKLANSDLIQLQSMQTEAWWDFSKCESSKDYIYLLRHLRNPNNLSQYVGYIKLAISGSEIISSLENKIQTDETSYFIITPESKVITSIHPDTSSGNELTVFSYDALFQQANSSDNSSITNNRIVSVYLLKNGLLVYSITKPEVLVQIRHTFFNTMSTIMIIVIIFALLLSMYFSKIITNPLKELGKSMTSLGEENFTARANVTGCTEIVTLAEHFNNMADRLEYLYKEQYLGEIKLKQSQLNVLQTQINPHFLYNTLDTIYWMSKMGANEKVSVMVTNLSQMMRLSLSSKNNDKIPLARELEHLSCYIAIQQIRHGAKIEFQVNCPNDLKDISVLSFLLQPLVENALVHGLSTCLNGYVHINIFAENNILIYDVSNNGVPVNVSEINRILQTPSDHSDLRGFALRNISERIHLKYGDTYALTCRLENDITIFRITQPADILPINDKSIERRMKNDKITTCR